MKKFIPLLLSAGMILGMNTIVYANSDVKIKVNGSLLSDAQAILKDGSTLLPVRSVSNALGGEVDWNADTKTASIDKDGTSVTITIGQKEISVNGKKQSISTPAQIISGRTYVPLRALGEALECDITWVQETKTVEIEQVDPSEYKAWYEVDADGSLNIRTNINSQKWNGYSLAIKLNYKGGSYGWDTQEGSGIVTFDINSLLSNDDVNSIVKETEFYVFKSRDSREKFWALYKQFDDHKKAISAMGDQFVCQFKLNNKIMIKELDQPIQFTDFKITYDKTSQQETYTAVIANEIEKTGEYGLLYETTGHNRNAGMSYIKKGDGILTFTREMHHFANPGASGTFFISYCTHIMNPDGSIICYKSVSNGIDYRFPLYY